MKTETRARAKLNISLDVLGKRPDGFHEMRMIMAAATLYDDITIETETASSFVKTNLRYLPNDSRNIAMKAAELFFEKSGIKNSGTVINIKKRIPVCAGLGGGSADAAAVLDALNEMYGGPLSRESLMEMSAALGSDVPYCLMGGAALAEGRGEVLTALPPLPDCHIVICKPRLSHSTGTIFAKLAGRKLKRHPDTSGIIAAMEQGDIINVARRMYNVFEDVLDRSSPCLEIKRDLINCGADGAVMSGTGTAVFGIFSKEEDARMSFEAMKRNWDETFLCRPER